MKNITASPGKPQAFSKHCRFLCRADFNRVFRCRQVLCVRRGYFTIYSCPNHTAARLGVVVSCKAAPRAVTRNRIKRFVRDSFRRCRMQLPAADFAVVCHASMARLDRFQLAQRLHEAWQMAMQKYRLMHSVAEPPA